MKATGAIFEERERFHAQLMKNGLTISASGIPAIADKGSRLSIRIAKALMEELGESVESSRLAGQTSGKRFEEACAEFLKRTFSKLNHIRPGIWDIFRLSQGDKLGISRFQQYAHINNLFDLCRENPELASAVGYDYIISPDIIIARTPETDEKINRNEHLVDTKTALKTGLRQINNKSLILHASI